MCSLALSPYLRIQATACESDPFDPQGESASRTYLGLLRVPATSIILFHSMLGTHHVFGMEVEDLLQSLPF
ncbi:MAG: hypothetical protein ACI835_000802 [Planctomycetota bacterium]|jgi:hypothetical protein